MEKCPKLIDTKKKKMNAHVRECFQNFRKKKSIVRREDDVLKKFIDATYDYI